MEMLPPECLFRDRQDAGHQLATALKRYRDAKDAIVLALPRGGVVLGYEISTRLHLQLDVLVTRKLGTPGCQELAMGALAESGYRQLNSDVIREFGITQREIEDESQRQQREIDRRIQRYRNGGPLPAIIGRTVILVDDGIATGATFYASLEALRSLRPNRLVAAVPVAPPSVPAELRAKVHEVVILATPGIFFGIGQFYMDFKQVEDEEVVWYLEQAEAALHGDPGTARSAAR
jgi:putative phosphoribosyl transferase